MNHCAMIVFLILKSVYRLSDVNVFNLVDACKFIKKNSVLVVKHIYDSMELK